MGAKLQKLESVINGTAVVYHNRLKCQKHKTIQQKDLKFANSNIKEFFYKKTIKIKKELLTLDTNL